jgi:hypothetical protein
MIDPSPSNGVDDMEHPKRKRMLIIGSVLFFTALNVAFHFAPELRDHLFYLLLYVATVNGAFVGYLAGHFCAKIFEKKGIQRTFLYLGVFVGLVFGLVWVNYEICTELRMNKSDAGPPFSHFRFYSIGLLLGIVKSVYYAIVPSIVLFTGVGILVNKVFRVVRKNS